LYAITALFFMLLRIFSPWLTTPRRRVAVSLRLPLDPLGLPITPSILSPSRPVSLSLSRSLSFPHGTSYFYTALKWEMTVSEPSNQKSVPYLTLPQIERGMRLSIFDGVLAQPFYSLAWPTSVFFTGLALVVGANNFEIGLLAAISPLLSGLFLLAAHVLERVGRRRTYYLISASIHRVVFFGLLLLPLLGNHLPINLRIALLFLIVLISVSFGSFQTTAWMSWMADMVPEDKRGGFFSKRNMLCGAMWMALSWPVGKFLDGHNSLWGYSFVFSAATVLALVALFFVARQPEPPLVLSEKRIPFLTLWKNAWGMPGFRNFLLFQLAWGFTTNLAGPFYNVYMLQNLHIDLARITLWGIVGGIIGTVTMPYWGLLGDRAGNRPTLLFCLIGSCCTAFLWLFITPDNLSWMMVLIFVLGGFFDTGIGLIAFNMILGVLPEKNKPSYLAIYETVVGTLVGVAPAFGGYLAQNLPRVQLPILTLDSVLLVIAISTVIRLIPLLFITKVPTKSGHDFGFMMREFVLINPFKLFPNLTFVKKSAEKKVAAIDSLSQMKSKAALPDLIKSMHDLSPRVRQRAVQALGEIGDRQALSALMGALDDPLEDIQGEAILALGKLGDRQVVPVLLKKLDSTDPHLQRCAATALGDLKDPESSTALIVLLQTTQRTSVMLACADALGRLGEYNVVEPLLEITRQIKNPSVKHSVVASIGTLVDEKGELYQALSHPEQFTSKAADEILSTKVVKLAKSSQTTLRKNLSNAMQAYQKHNFNEAILEMKVMNQIMVRECLARKELKDSLGFEQWVRLLDSNYSNQLHAINQMDKETGIALAIVDYYARHCPSPAEPDMDNQEFLLALFAFKAGQSGLSTMLFGKDFMDQMISPNIEALRSVVTVA
jgi:MFS family permease